MEIMKVKYNIEKYIKVNITARNRVLKLWPGKHRVVDVEQYFDGSEIEIYFFCFAANFHQLPFYFAKFHNSKYFVEFLVRRQSMDLYQEFQNILDMYDSSCHI